VVGAPGAPGTPGERGEQVSGDTPAWSQRLASPLMSEICHNLVTPVTCRDDQDLLAPVGRREKLR
jgi:hypothetical protein